MEAEVGAENRNARIDIYEGRADEFQGRLFSLHVEPYLEIISCPEPAQCQAQFRWAWAIMCKQVLAGQACV